MDYKVVDGIYFLDEKLSILEKWILDACCRHLKDLGFEYLSIPSMIKYGTFKRQDITLPVDIMAIANDTEACLAGSAEQGILERFVGQEVKLRLIYAKNQCFRNETEYEGLLRVREFIKVEQFCFTTKDSWEEQFELLMNSAISFLMRLGVKHRVVDVTSDPGYHIKKRDIQIETKTYGWIESHSCTYFGEEQTKRFGITGATHTLSNTGIASPRILIPFIEGLAGLAKTE
jgi:seryl-tRNA synthetase